MITDYIRLTTDLEAAGVALPEKVTTARAIALAARQAAAAQPTAELMSEYHAGKITPATVAKKMQATAVALTAAERIRTVLTDIENGVYHDIRAGVAAEAEVIMGVLQDVFDEAAVVVQSAGRYFGSGASAEQILAGGVEAVIASQQLTASLQKLTQVRVLRVALADLGYGEPEQDATWYIAGAKDAEDLDRAHRAFTDSGDAFHNLTAAGFTLRLNTPAEAQAVANGARHATSQRLAAEREAALARHRKSWGPTLECAAAQAEAAAAAGKG